MTRTSAHGTGASTEHAEVTVLLRQRLGNAIDPDPEPLASAIDLGTVALMKAATLRGHLPTAKPTVRVIRRGADAEVEQLPDTVYSALIISAPIRCAHGRRR